MAQSSCPQRLHASEHSTHQMGQSYMTNEHVHVGSWAQIYMMDKKFSKYMVLHVIQTTGLEFYAL